VQQAKPLPDKRTLVVMTGTVKVSISSTFYAQFFCTKVFCPAFIYLWFGFVIFWIKNIGPKAARKMLMKLTTGEQKSNYIFSFRTFQLFCRQGQRPLITFSRILCQPPFLILSKQLILILI